MIKKYTTTWNDSVITYNDVTGERTHYKVPNMPDDTQIRRPAQIRQLMMLADAMAAHGLLSCEIIEK